MMHQVQAQRNELRRRCYLLSVVLRDTDLSAGQRSLLEAAQRGMKKALEGQDVLLFHRRGRRNQRLPLI